ncbi:hypothetical protein M3Y94_00280100 [Aphelenchoides besseyi]|nr:hypothetical protein M3Y94_00280100 [Aphelenchoides besseyi]
MSASRCSGRSKGSSRADNNNDLIDFPNFLDGEKYRMPEDVSNVLLRDGLNKPTRDHLLCLITDHRLSFSQCLRKVDDCLEEYMSKLDNDNIYLCLVDLIIWCGTLREFFGKTSKSNTSRWLCDRILIKFDHERTKRDQTLLQKASARQLDRNLCWPFAFEAIFGTKHIDEFARCLCNDKIIGKFAYFVLEKIEFQTGQAFRWIAKLELYRHSHTFSIKNLVYCAITKRETGSLLEICKSDSTKLLAKHVVLFLDSIAGTFFNYIDPEDVQIKFDSKINSIRSHDKEVVNLAFNYMKIFQLDKSLVDNCVFVRRMNAFIKNFKDYQNVDRTPAFYQKAIYTMGPSQRGRIAGLSFLAQNSAHETALMLAAHIDFPPEKWPSNLLYDKVEFEEISKKVAKEREIERSEHEKYKNGFNMLKSSTHWVQMIDNEESVNTILRPFIEDPKNTCFGFDAEGDQSWCGEMGTLSLIQLSGQAQTLLIDIHVLKENHQWNDEKFLEMFELIFSHEKPLYGYGFENDLKVIVQNFPLTNENIFSKSKNLICLLNTIKIIRDDAELCPKILGSNSTIQLNLSAVVQLILGLRLDKGEQASVWGGFRPLRRLQQRYAAQDAFAVLQLGKKLEHMIKQDFPHKLRTVFEPFIWMKDRGVVPNFLKETSNSRKTKCSQFTDQELKTIVRNVNTILAERQQPVIRLAQAIYIADQTCAQLGSTLRRIGINVTVGENPDQISNFMDTHLSAKILSTGKACKRYSYDKRILNVPTSHPLDVQLSWILTEEKIYIVSNEIRPRCINCNGQQMVYIPHCVMKYLHNRLAIEKSFNWDVSVEEIVEVEKEINAIKSFASPNQFVALASGDFGLTITINKTLVFLDTVMMCPPRAHASDPERMIKLRLSLHRNIFKEPNNTARPSAVCMTCGKENNYTSST